MPLSPASRLADFGTGIGTAGAVLKVDNPNKRVGIGTQIPAATLGVAGIVSATAFYGDGSNLDGVASAGLGTALSEIEFDPLTVIYQTSDTLSVPSTITVDPPDATSKVAYTQYAEIKLEDGADLIVAEGDDFIPDILGLSTEGAGGGAAYGNNVFNTVYTDNIEKADGRGAPNFPKGINVSYTGVSTFTGNVSIGGTLTYEDVTNVDSIGVVTARSGIDITGGDLNAASNLILKTDGSEKVRIDSSGNVGINEAGPAGYGKFVVKGTGNIISLNASSGAASLSFFENGQGRFYIKTPNGSDGLSFVDADNSTERLRIGPAGQLGVAGANYGSSGQVLTSGGPSAAPQWADAGGGEWTLLASGTPTSGTHSVITESLITSTYWRYKVVFNMNCTAQGLFGFQIKNGSGWITSATYFHHQFYVDGNTETSDYYNNGEFMRPFWFPDGGRQWRGTLNLWNPSASDGEKYWHYENVQALNQSTYDGSSYFWSGGQSVSGSFRSNTSAITGLRMYMEEGITERCGGGTDTAGVSQWVLYGAKSS